MKVALCLSGQVREYEKVFENHNVNILKKLIPDVFIHTWTFRGTQKLYRYWQSEYQLERDYDSHIREDNLTPLSGIIKDYQPKKMLTEFPDKEIFMKKLEASRNPNLNIFNMLMMYYSIYMSNEMKKSHEKEKNFTYDVVIRSRFDIMLENVNLTKQMNNSTIYLPPNIDVDVVFTEEMKQKLEAQGPSYMPNDKFAYGSSQAMDYYSSIYKKYNQDIDVYTHHNERTLTEHLWLKNKSKFKPEVDYDIKLKLYKS